MTIRDIENTCLTQLKQNNIEDAILKTKIIISNALNVNKQYLVTHDNEKLENKTLDRIMQDIQKLLEGEPIQYITKTQDFFGLEFYIDNNVLIPQPDTENLVEEVLEISKQMDKPEILDLCTGSGAIAIALKKNMPNLNITASDISTNALNIAKINTKNNNVKIKFLQSDMFTNIKQSFNIIVSNPPYIKTNIIKTLSKEVQNEPLLALDGGQDGLKYYRIIANESYKYLKDNGFLCLEIGYDQKQKVIELLEKSGKYTNIYLKKDLSGNDRVIICNKK